MPLYIAAFLQGIPFWYAIEKLFMTSIGFTTASIGVMVAIMSAVMLAVETPSGVLADRWSRAGVMFLGGLALLISGIIGGLSYDQPMYILSTVFWGIYAALYSGTYDAVIYDTLIEETGESSRYEYYLGRLRMFEGVAFVVGSLGGSLIASQLSMRSTYFISIPIIAAAGLFLWKFREPKLHKTEVAEPVFRHIRQTFRAVLRNRLLLPVIIAAVGFAVLLDTLFELNQLWFIAVDTPLTLYGLAGATLFSTWALGGLVASKFRGQSASLIGIVILLLALITLVATRSYWIILAAQFLLSMFLILFGVILSKKMHDQLPSKLRAGASSVISTLGRIIIIPGSLLFTGIANGANVFIATYLLLGIAVIASCAYAFTLRIAAPNAT